MIELFESDKNKYSPIKKPLLSIQQDKTEVKTRDGASEFTYSLDEGLVEFGTAVNDNDFGRAILFLETLGDVPAAKAMWHNLANVALNQQNILVNIAAYRKKKNT